MGLGSCEDMPLDEVRDKARELRRQIRDGLDPIAEGWAAKARARLETVPKHSSNADIPAQPFVLGCKCRVIRNSKWQSRGYLSPDFIRFKRIQNFS